MYVKIGKHLNWWGPYQIIDLLQYIGVSKDKCYKIAEATPDWMCNVCQWIYDKRKRSIKIKIDRYDVWNLDSTLALIILPALKILQKEKNGTPILDVMSQTSNSSQYCFDFYEEGDDAAWQAGQAQWDTIMDKMIWSFEQIVTSDWEDQYTIQAAEIDFTDYPEDEGKTSTPLRWKQEGVYDFEGMRAHERRIQEGLELFGKYYQNLWD